METSKGPNKTSALLKVGYRASHVGLGESIGTLSFRVLEKVVGVLCGTSSRAQTHPHLTKQFWGTKRLFRGA